jgi:hypothetical protein
MGLQLTFLGWPSGIFLTSMREADFLSKAHSSLSSALWVSLLACPLVAKGKEGQNSMGCFSSLHGLPWQSFFPNLESFLGNQVNSHSPLSTLQLLINACSVLNSLSYLKRKCRSCTFVVTIFFFKAGFLPGFLKGPYRFPLLMFENTVNNNYTLCLLYGRHICLMYTHVFNLYNNSCHRNSYCPHFTDKVSGVQKGQILCPRSICT